jgi:P4 family phage/plasmid primase-like protien
MAVNVNDMSIKNAAKYYASLGVITHLLHGPDAKVKSPGKQPLLGKWQKLERPFTDGEIESRYSNAGNLGFLCGQRSDLTVLDIDWAVKGIWDNILKGVDTSDWVKQDHTELKYHYLFRYFNDIKAKTYPGLGFDVLSDTTQVDNETGLQCIVGNNCVAAPSTHPDGNKYKITGNINERPVIPEIVKTRINNVTKLYKEINDEILPKCRRSFQGLWDALFIDKKHEFYHKTSIFVGDKENRDRHLHLCAELKANGATDLHLALVCMMILGDRYDPITTEKELQQIKPLPATKESILKDPYLGRFFIASDGTKMTEENGYVISNKGKPKKINVPFDVVSDRILREFNIFTMQDSKQVYIYSNGVYKSEGSDVILDKQVRIAHNEVYIEYWNQINPAHNIGHTPKATTRYVAEVIAHIKAFTYIPRESIEEDQKKYLNFKNKLFNLDTWELEPHTPKIKTICQIPVDYNEKAECPRINKFLKDVVAELDIDLLCELAGYCLTPDCSHQKAFMLYGVGSNGKNVFLALLESFVGKDNTSAESLHKLEHDKYQTAKLYGKRVNICGDIPDSKMHKTEIFKKLTSGLDLIDGENKYQDSFVFRNTAKLVFSANVLPEVKRDKAYYRRWQLIQFPNNFEGGTEDRLLITKLQEPNELSGFLNLALAALKRLNQKGKFTNSKFIEETQKEYELNSNQIAAFMEERTQISDEDCEATILYLEYVDWCNSCGKDHLKNIGFSRKLISMGYISHRDNVPGYNSRK